MFPQLEFDEFKKLAQYNKRIAVFRTVPSDKFTPITVFQALQNESAQAVLLESAVESASIGRYSFIALQPFAQFSAKGGIVKISQGQNYREESIRPPIDVLKAFLEEMRCAQHSDLPYLSGGAVGFFSYDAIRLFEAIPGRHPDKEALPDIFFLCPRIVFVFDHHKGMMSLSLLVETGEDLYADYSQAQKEIDLLLEKITRPGDESIKQKPAIPRAVRKLEFEPRESSRGSIDRKEVSEGIAKLQFADCAWYNTVVQDDIDDLTFCKKVEEAKEYIRRGDAYQIVLSRKFQRSYSVEPLTIYRSLRIISPSAFMFYFQTPEFSLAGASPERLIKVANGTVETMPIAGTSSRGVGDGDLQQELALLADEKEAAEHMMLVDVGRNDIGAVAEIGTVTVKELKTVHRFSHVMHLVSVVSATLKAGCDSFDALKAAFPAATLCGAPKIRAMEIVDLLETSRRGLYGGAICAIDNYGNLDSCIAIRMAQLKNGIASVRTGAGIVFDSDPQKEADETRHKARSVLEAIRIAEEDLV